MRFKPYTFKELTEKQENIFRLKKDYNFEWFNKLSDETIYYLKENKKITLDEYINSRGNSYDWKTKYTLLDNEALIRCIDQNSDNLTSIDLNSRYSVDTTYEEALRNTLLPTLLDRFEQLNADFKEVLKVIKDRNESEEELEGVGYTEFYDILEKYNENL